MKLDRLKFARLIAHVQFLIGRRESLTVEDVNDIDYLIDIDVTPVEVPGKADPATINELMRAIHAGEKITAIKAYRTLTGYGLKEAKDAVEEKWNDKTNRMITKIDQQMLGVNEEIYILQNFHNDQLKLVKEFIKSFY